MRKHKILKLQIHHKKLAMLCVLFCLMAGRGYGQASFDVSKPVGMTAGEAGSNGVGAATYQIPIDIPSGIKGVQPSVSITYSSQGVGNGFTGHGWTLSSLSMIGRTGKDVFHNGIATPINFTGSNDAFVMDGQRLILVSGTNGAAGSIYGTEQESFSKIEAIGGNGNSPDWFKVTTKTGTILEYGTDNSKLKTNDGVNVIFWMLRKVTDASGNYVLYHYNIDNTNRYYSLGSITYTGNTNTGTQPNYQVVFTYSNKTDYQSSPAYIAGSNIYSAKILDRVDVKKADGTQIRSYAFTYEYRQKKYFLTKVTEAGADGTTLNPVTFGYGKSPTGSDVLLTGEYTYATDRNYTGDFDGDGRTDIQTYAYTLNTSNGDIWYKWYQIYDYDNGSIGGKYSYNMQTDIPNANVKVLGKDAVQNPFAINDFDGDGKEDVLIAKFNTSNSDFKGININYSRVDVGWNPDEPDYKYKKVAYDNLPSSWAGQHLVWKKEGSFFVSGDFDGDGNLDYILILGMPKYFMGLRVGSKNFKAFLSTPSKNVINQEITGFGAGVNGASGDFAADVIAEAKAIIPINFDGDAKTELLVVRNEGSYVISVYPVPPSSGYTYASSMLYFSSGIKTDYKIFPADFNGDGNTDLFVRASKDDENTPWKIFLSTGKGFIQSTFNYAYKIILPGDGFSNSHMLNIGDFDRDGKSDIWHSLDLSGASSRHVIYYSNGTSFTFESSDLAQSTNPEFMYSGGDFNGDGKPDLLKGRKVSDNDFPVKFLMAKPFKEKNLLATVGNIGYETKFDYALLNGKDNYAPTVYSRTEGEYSDDDYFDPIPHFPDYVVPAPAMYVVAKIMRPNGLGGYSNEKFNYQDLILHTQGRGFLGFKRTDVANDMNIVNSTKNKVNTDYSMLTPEATEMNSESWGLMSCSSFTITFKYVSPSYFTNRRFFIKTDRILTNNWLTGEVQEVLNTYDDYGNVTQSVVNAGSSDGENITSIIEHTTTNTTYSSYAGAPYPGFPTAVTVQKTRTGKPAAGKSTNYTYTSQGLPQTVTEFAGTSIATTVTNTYNGFGLPVQVTTAAPDVSTPTVNYVYDAKGLFVLEKKLTGGGIVKKETATFDERWQTPLTQTTTDGLTTTCQYNTFGELVQTTLPDGNVIVSSKSWETSGNARFSILTQRSDGTKPVKLYLDILGREIKKEARGYSNKWLTSTKTFNSFGQLYKESVPYYTDEPINYTTYSYDNYGRITYTTNNTGSVTTSYTYTGNTYTVKTTNAAGQWTSKTTDATGRVISSSDNGVEMQFTYDSWGNQLTAANNAQTLITNVFDSYGRKQSTTDLNAGTITYEYNALGQITKQTDAKGQIQTTTYDAFGRIATATGPQGTTTYTYYYDAGTQKSNDNLTQVTGFGGDVSTYQYDNLQRLTSESLSTGSTTLTKSYTYNAYGDLATTTYPAGFTIRNDYNTDGMWLFTKYEIGGSSSYLYVTMGMNSRGVRTGYLINNKFSNTEYDFGKEVITRYNTPGVLDLSLVYQANTLNLLSRKDNIRNITEAFTYDTHDRLTSATVNGVQQFAMSYDAGAQGKILQKTDIGNYSYDAQKIHQLKYLTPISGGADPATIIGANTRDITYTPFLKTQSIAENGYELTYTYGSDRQRLTSTLKQNGTTIESKIYWGNMEVVTKGGVTSEVYYIAGPAGLTNIIVKKSGVISMYNAYTDQLGSILAVATGSGGMVAEQNFDAWGRNRNPNDWGYSNVPVNPDWLYRGYTGHEHLTAFRLINMNGRMYDPMTGLMLSPDNYVPMPWSPGGYNRYGYANGNPLKYVDPTGWLTHDEFDDIINDLWNSKDGGYWNESEGTNYFTSGDEAFGYGAGQMSQNGWWGGGGGRAGSPQEALNRYNSYTGTSGITSGMWNGYMQAKWYGYAYNVSTSNIYTAGMGAGFISTGFTFEDAKLDAIVLQSFSYSYAEKMFFEWRGSGGNVIDQMNWMLGMGALGLTNAPGSFRFTNGAYNGSALSFRYYYSGWRGGSRARITTYNIGRIGSLASRSLTAIGIATDYLRYRQGQISVERFSFNSSMGIYGLTGIGTIPSALYFGVDALYPGGWLGDGAHSGAIMDQARLIEANRKIIPRFNLYRDW